MALGMTQEELAERMGVGKAAVSLMESGRRATQRRATLEKYAEALGVPVEDLEVPEIERFLERQGVRGEMIGPIAEMIRASRG